MAGIDNLTADDVRAAVGQLRVDDDPALDKTTEATSSEAHASEREMFRQSAKDRIAGLEGVGAILVPLLQASGWRGQDRNLFEALPHMGGVDDIDIMRNVLLKINIQTFKRNMCLNQLKDGMLPCIVVFSPTHCAVVIDKKGDDLLAFDSLKKDYVIFDANSINYEIYILSEADPDEEAKQTQVLGWVSSLVVKFRSVIRQLIFISFITSVVGVAVPLYVMNVYDKVIPTRSVEVLGYLGVAALVIILVDVGLRLIRGRTIAFLGARFETLLGSMAYRQILYMPIERTEKSSIGDQVSRLRQFESMRDLFSGPLATTILDLPFTLIFLAGVIFIGGAASWIPVALIATFIVIATVAFPMTRYLVKASAETRNSKQHFLLEMISNQETIKAECAEDVWVERYKDISSASALSQMKINKLNMIIQNLSSGLMMLSGVAMLAYATILAMNQEISLGALIALMSLVWKVLAPIQAMFTNFTKFEQTLQSAGQVNMMMRLALERNPAKLSTISRKFRGDIGFTRVNFRYSNIGEAVIQGLTCNIKAGQIVGITGTSGSGKSSILKLIAGLYTPQSGVISLDGLDSRQISKGDLRHSVSYVPQKPYFFFGTVDQNIRLNEPSASDEDVRRSMADLGIEAEVEGLENGMNTRLSAGTKAAMSESLKQRLSLARAFVKDVPIYLLDEPGNHLDREQSKALLRKLESMRGERTVIMTSHNLEHLAIADHLLVLDQGQLVKEGPPEKILPELKI